MASYSVNQAAVVRARKLIDSRQYVLDSNWAEVQPTADDGSESWPGAGVRGSSEHAGLASQARLNEGFQHDGTLHDSVLDVDGGAVCKFSLRD